MSTVHSRSSVLTEDHVARGSPADDALTFSDATAQDSGRIPHHLEIQAKDVTLTNSYVRT